MATIWRNAGICSARTVSRNWSAAVLAVTGSAPLASAYRVPDSLSRALGVHLRHERRFRTRVPVSQHGGDVVAGRDKHRFQRLTLGQLLPALHLDDRLPLPLVAGVGRRVGRGHGDRRARPARGQRMVAEHHVRGHDLGQAGDGHRPVAAVRAERPMPGSPTAASAPPGQSGRGAVPGRTCTVVTEAVRVTGGTGRSSCTATQATAAVRMTPAVISKRGRSFRARPGA